MADQSEHVIREIPFSEHAIVIRDTRMQDLLDSLDDSERAQALAELETARRAVAQLMADRIEAMMIGILSGPVIRAQYPSLPDAPKT